MKAKGASRENRGNWRAAAAWGSASAAVAVSALMLLTPLASATVITKPYYSWGVGTSVNVQKYGCGTAHTVVAPTFGKRIGVAHASGGSTAPKCAPSPIGNEGFWDASVALDKVISFASNASTTVNATWSFSFSDVWNNTPYKTCKLNYNASYSSCETDAEATVYTYMFLTDNTNSSWYGSYGYGFAIGGFVDLYNFSYSQNWSQNYCYAGTCSHYGGNSSYNNSGSLTGGFTGVVKAISSLNLSGLSAPNAGDKYTLQLYLLIDTIAVSQTQSAKGTGTPYAAASINMAGGFGATLKNVIIS